METIHTVEWMKQAARAAAHAGRVVGLVPTMGALHEGHASLIRAARAQCAPVVVSVFVNPKQFGPNEDFEKYPRRFEADREFLSALGVDYIFAPAAAEMYPQGFCSSLSLDGLSDRYEGRARPGHFRGVTTVVLKLLEIVRPDFAYFGRKDAQQARLISQMAADLNLDAGIVVCPIVREADGLALSSRNAYLNEQERKAATVLYRALGAAKREIGSSERDTLGLLSTIRGMMKQEPLVTLDYAEVVDSETLEPVMRVRKSCLILLAAVVGKTRLIDNALIEEEEDSLRVTV